MLAVPFHVPPDSVALFPLEGFVVLVVTAHFTWPALPVPGHVQVRDVAPLASVLIGIRLVTP
jgi:hypothetical protein